MDATLSKDTADGLVNDLSTSAVVLTDSQSPEFIQSMKRWSKVDLSIPSAIIVPAKESDIFKIITLAAEKGIPFVCKAGGYSHWSTIGSGGWIIDLLNFRGIKLDTDSQTVTVQAGVISRDLNQALDKERCCIPTPNISGVGYLPFVLGGGMSLLAGISGTATDAIVSAKVVTATRGLVTASKTENADLFWALKGAGQFFGVVTELKMKFYPWSQDIISWACVFSAAQVKEVGAVLEQVINVSGIGRSPGFVAVLESPVPLQPMIMVSMSHFCSEEEAAAFMAPFIAIGPLQQMKRVVGFGQVTTFADMKDNELVGTYRDKYSCGLQAFRAEIMEKSLDLWRDIVKEDPNSAKTVVMHTLYGEDPMKGDTTSAAWTHRDCKLWSMIMAISEDEASYDGVKALSGRFLEDCREGQSEEEKASFPNNTREQMQYAYRGREVTEKLGVLKRKWDPKGLFGNYFL